MLDFPVDDTLGWESIIESMDSKKDFHKIYSNFEESNVINFLSIEKNNPNSIISCLKGATYNSEFIKDDLPRSSVEELNNIQLFFQKEMTLKASKRKRAKNIYEVISSSQRFFGIISDNFSRGSVIFSDHLRKACACNGISGLDQASFAGEKSSVFVSPLTL